MKRVARSEILPLGEYEAVREPFRRRVIADKARRRVTLGPAMSAVFENHDTVLLQVQEMLRTERISLERAVRHELGTYNQLIPEKDGLSATLFVEIADQDERERMLVALAGLERHVALEFDGVRVPARGERQGARPDRTTAVHYLLFDLPPETARDLRAGAVQDAALVVDHPAYRARAALAEATLAELRQDLCDASGS